MSESKTDNQKNGKIKRQNQSAKPSERRQNQLRHMRIANNVFFRYSFNLKIRRYFTLFRLFFDPEHAIRDSSTNHR